MARERGEPRSQELLVYAVFLRIMRKPCLVRSEGARRYRRLAAACERGEPRSLELLV